MAFQFSQDFMMHFNNAEDDGTNTTVLPNPEFLSIYIPFLPNNLILDCYSCENGLVKISQALETETDFKYLFEETLWVGKVKRIDFVIRDGKKCAFVHFHHWFDNANAKQMQTMIKTSISAKVKSFTSGSDSYRFRIDKKIIRNGIEQTIQESPFLSFKQNFKVIPEFTTPDDVVTLPNIHQVMHWNAELEKTVAEQKARIQELEQLLELKQRVAVEQQPEYRKYAANNCKDCEKELCVCGLSV